MEGAHCEGIPSVLCRGTISTVERMFSTVGGYHQYCGEIPSVAKMEDIQYCTSSTMEVIPKFLVVSSIVMNILNSTYHSTIMMVAIPNSTEHPSQYTVQTQYALNY